MIFKNSVLNYLTEMGWSEDRRVSPQDYLTFLMNDGYETFHCAEVFLANFGGLEGLMPSYKKVGNLERIHFNPAKAIDNIYRERVVDYEISIGESLALVGEAYNGHLFILISKSGKLYGAFDDYLCLLGDSVEDGIATLLLRLPPKVINLNSV